MPIGYSTAPAGALDRIYRRCAELGSRLTPDTASVLSESAYEGFRRAQRLAYACVTEIGRQLRPGMTEVQAAEMLKKYLIDHGSDRYLHRPFAWFGEHARFDGYAGYGDYHPGQRRLAQGEVAILDVSPMVGGYTADVGYSLSVGPNLELARARAFLLELRALIPQLFAGRMNPSAIWSAVDQRIREAGYDNIHARYPFAVLGHRIFRVKARAQKAVRFGGGSFGWFSLEANLKFLRNGFAAALSPENVGSKRGLWAIEPHIGWNGAGAKFEEILIVDHHGARWLDDAVPHVQQASASRAAC